MFLKRKKEKQEKQESHVMTPTEVAKIAEREKKEKIDRLKSEIREQIEKISQLSDKGIWAYLRANGCEEMEPDSEELFELMNVAIERYPFAELKRYLRPFGNAFLDEHPYPDSNESAPYKEFSDELWDFERLTRFYLKCDLMLELGHSAEDVQTVEYIGKNGSIEFNMTSAEQLQGKAELSDERYEELKQCAIDYLENKSTWEDEEISIEKRLFEIHLVDFFSKKKASESNKAEHELMDELEKFAEELT